MSTKIFISGCPKELKDGNFNSTRETLVKSFGYKLIESFGNDIEIVNGNGKGVGKILYESVAEATIDYDLVMAEHFKLFPFPRKYYEHIGKPKKLEKDMTEYRKKIISNCGVAFFLYGNKKDKDGNIINADGVLKEFDEAFKEGKYFFPIKCTDHMSRELAENVHSDLNKYYSEKNN